MQVLKPSWARATTTGYGQHSLWGYPGIAIFRAESDYISIVKLVMCSYIQMNVVLNMVLVMVVICNYGSRVRGDSLSLLVYSEQTLLCHHLIHLMCEYFGAIFNLVLVLIDHLV